MPRLFVEDKGIPIAKLLLPFGIMLVRQLTDERSLTNLSSRWASSPRSTSSVSSRLPARECQSCSRSFDVRLISIPSLRNREKLDEYNTVDDAVELIRRSKRILVLTGAGVSYVHPPT